MAVFFYTRVVYVICLEFASIIQLDHGWKKSLSTATCVFQSRTNNEHVFVLVVYLVSNVFVAVGMSE
jgi:hypothetical protein